MLQWVSICDVQLLKQRSGVYLCIGELKCSKSRSDDSMNHCLIYVQFTSINILDAVIEYCPGNRSVELSR